MVVSRLVSSVTLQCLQKKKSIFFNIFTIFNFFFFFLPYWLLSLGFYLKYRMAAATADINISSNFLMILVKSENNFPKSYLCTIFHLAH